VTDYLATGTTTTFSMTMPSNVWPAVAPDGVDHRSQIPEVNIVWVDGKFRLKERIGYGSFGLYDSFFYHQLTRIYSGIVYLGINIVSKKEVAIKLESVNTEQLQLQHEYEVYRSLTGIGIPSVQWFGTECDYNVLVLNQLGLSLE
jgi:casein kinase I family protein HRR25